MANDADKIENLDAGYERSIEKRVTDSADPKNLDGTKTTVENLCFCRISRRQYKNRKK